MKKIEFELLTKEEQGDIIYREAVYLGKRRSNMMWILLYQLEGFYIEVYYKKYRQEIAFTHISGNTDILDPYLEPINVDELISP